MKSKSSFYQKIFRFMVLVLGILLANLITIWLDEYVQTFRNNYKPYVFTLLAMLVVVVIYYPLFRYIDKWATKAAETFVRAGRKLVGRKIGAIFAFFVALAIIAILYGYEWYGRNVFVSLLKSLF